MSTVLKKVSDKTNAAAAPTPSPMTEQEMKRRKPSGKHAYKPHLATKVKWCLEDSMDRAVAAQGRMRHILEWLEEARRFPGASKEFLALIGKLDHEFFGLALEVSELERIVARGIAESKPEADK